MRAASLLLLLLLAIASVVSATVADFYANSYTGDGTYYGYTNGGACTLRVPSAPSTADAVRSGAALNAVQWNGAGAGLACGMCIRINASGVGLGVSPINGTFDVIIDDLCPGCASGDIDLAYTGDGRWNIQWYAVDCQPTGNVQYVYQGSNPYYIKVQIRNTRVPAASARLNNGGTFVNLAPTGDNFFSANGLNPKLGNDVTIEWTSVKGEVKTDTIVGSQVGGTWQNSKVFDGNFQFAGYGSVPLPPAVNTHQPSGSGSSSGARYVAPITGLLIAFLAMVLA